MKTLTVEEATRNIAEVLAEVERTQTEIAVVRDHQPIARIVPEPQGLPALEMFADMGGTLDKETGDVLARNIEANRQRKSGRLSELRNPWRS